jgi:hypothetical protein
VASVIRTFLAASSGWHLSLPSPRHEFNIKLSRVQHSTLCFLGFNRTVPLRRLETEPVLGATARLTAPTPPQRILQHTAYNLNSVAGQRPEPRSGKTSKTPHPVCLPPNALNHNAVLTMTDTNTGGRVEGSKLRERPSVKTLHLQSSDDAKHKVLALNEQEEKEHKDDDQKKRTYGRTPDGTGTWAGAVSSMSLKTAISYHPKRFG